MDVRELANAGKNGAGQDTGLRAYILEEFIEDYQEGEINRREALQRIAGITGSVAIASSILSGLRGAGRAGNCNGLRRATFSNRRNGSFGGFAGRRHRVAGQSQYRG